MVMTSKERILKTLQREKPDRIPWAPLIEYNFLNAQPENIRKLDIIGFCKKYKIDIIAKNTSSTYKVYSPNVIVSTYINGKQVDIPEEKDNWQAEIYNLFLLFKYRDPKIRSIEKHFETPHGVLKSGYVNIPSSKTVFQNEFFIKKIQDIKILKFMYEDIKYIPDYQAIKRDEKLIGDDGIVAAGVPGSPVIELIEEYMGVERFLFFLHDYKNEMEELFDIMLATDLEAYKVAAKSSCPLLIVWEDTGTGLYSPEIFRKYIKSPLRKYSEIAHIDKKVILVHSCGLINSLIEDILETGIDGITDIAPFPTGNVDLLDVRNRVGRDFLLTGGIDPTIIISDDKRLLRESVSELIDRMKPFGNFILGNADAMPANTPLENLEIIYETVEEKGYY